MVADQSFCNLVGWLVSCCILCSLKWPFLDNCLNIFNVSFIYDEYCFSCCRAAMGDETLPCEPGLDTNHTSVHHFLSSFKNFLHMFNVTQQVVCSNHLGPGSWKHWGHTFISKSVQKASKTNVQERHQTNLKQILVKVKLPRARPVNTRQGERENRRGVTRCNRGTGRNQCGACAHLTDSPR